MSNTSITDTIRLSAPAQRALAGAGITTLKQLATHTEEEIANLHGIGKNALEQLRTAMKEAGLPFKKN
jgi:DNA-directed RNA polymerase alpha subunit